MDSRSAAELARPSAVRLFNPDELRDPGGKWTRDDIAKKAMSLGLGEKFTTGKGHTVSHTVTGYRVRLKSGEAQTFPTSSKAADAAHSGRLDGIAPSAPAIAAPAARPLMPAAKAVRPAAFPADGLPGGQGYVTIDEPFAAKDKDTANMYTVASAGLNAPLRAGKQPEPRFRQFLKDMDALFRRTPATEKPIVAYRGTVSSVFGPRGSAAGTRFTDRGFVSLSASRKDAGQYGPAGDTAVMEIYVPVGSRVMKPGGSSQYAVAGLDPDSELVLNRGGSFEVVSDKIGPGGVRHMKVIYLGPAK